ncbi:MAG: AraC family transcriptional regulator ligand-binding domain-containing protein [Venatoribacter sp.]
MTAEIALSSFYLQQFGQLVDELGGDFAACVEAAGVSLAALDEPIFRGTWQQVEQFFGLALQQIQIPELGALFGERLLVHTHGALGYSVMNAATLSEALVMLESFIRIRIAFMHLQVANQNQLILRADIPLYKLERFFHEVVCMALKLALDFICQTKQVVCEVHFSFATPENAPRVEALFGCPVRYEQEQTALILTPSLLQHRIRIAEPAAFALAQKMCTEALAELSQNDSLSYRIKRLLLSSPNTFPSQEELCHRLHITSRTMHRNLAIEGTSFRKITDNIKQNLAKQYLAKGQHSQQEIAFLLGYSDAANFRRALRRWRLND